MKDKTVWQVILEDLKSRGWTQQAIADAYMAETGNSLTQGAIAQLKTGLTLEPSYSIGDFLLSLYGSAGISSSPTLADSASTKRHTKSNKSLTVTFEDFDACVIGGSIRYRQVQIDLTEEQAKQLALKKPSEKYGVIFVNEEQDSE